jgi:enterochelin esterase-like enzyme
MDEKLSLPTGETTWAEYSIFEFDSSILKYDGVNTIVVRAYNDGPYGGGGWYEGPIYLASKATEEGNAEVAQKDPYFYEETFTSACAAATGGQNGTVENPYLIYLPKDYYESEKSYPTLYMLHQFNSDHTSYKTDDINVVLDEAMTAGLLDEMIVVIPNSDENSWWSGEWETMITDELIPHIDDKYRTIPEAKYRLTAGCSMGGQGAFSVALKNPEYFSGAVSFFGAFSMPPSSEDDVMKIVENATKEELEQFSLYFSCGNQDVYGFGKCAIELNQLLSEKGVEHEFFIENGGHDSAFYLPKFVDALGYATQHMK